MVKPKPPSSPPALAGQPQQTVVEKYKGVRKRKWGKYVSEIRLPNCRERIWLGSFETAEKAARAFDAAQFCLRGHDVSFNFPHDPPNISGGQSLTPAEIQLVAAQYGNSDCSNQPAPIGLEKQIMDSEGGSSQSNLEYGATSALDPMDWSFLDVLDSNAVGSVSDFNFFSYLDSFSVHAQSVLAHEDNDYIDPSNLNPEEHFSQQCSFLWNF